MKKIAIIGASYLQEPLIRKAKIRGIETHVFAWQTGDVGEKSADHFYPISITEKEQILEKCTGIGIDGVCSISSDLASVTVNYVADALGLVGNSPGSVLLSTNKYMMRKSFEKNGDPSLRFAHVTSSREALDVDLRFPLIVKPVDRSGSRGVTKVDDRSQLAEAVDRALSVGFEKSVVVEEFARGVEYSVEYISWEGKHSFLSVTKKYTTGAPHFIETAHLEPADIDEDILVRIKSVVEHALDSLGIRYGASHSEIMISDQLDITLIEIGARMGGDNIGSSLVELSTGYDFVGGVIDVCLGIPPVVRKTKNASAGIRFIFSDKDVKVLERIRRDRPELIVEEDVHRISSQTVTDSSTRFGYFTLASDDPNDIKRYMPGESEEV
ncbi:MAG: ATP-grasp domain-containing protein [Lachnospiraceae bacterium]|nr:ATP-grasp domain-containing protein [Lachnospiraceae bacterium]